MKLIEQESILMTSDDENIILTTHRIRKSNYSADLEVSSIMLEHVSSCEYRKRSKPLLLVLAIILFLICIYEISKFGMESTYVYGTGVLFVLCAIIYFVTIKQGIIISSSSCKIFINVKGMNDTKILHFIDMVESAKNNRFLRLFENKSTQNPT